MEITGRNTRMQLLIQLRGERVVVKFSIAVNDSNKIKGGNGKLHYMRLEIIFIFIEKEQIQPKTLKTKNQACDSSENHLFGFNYKE